MLCIGGERGMTERGMTGGILVLLVVGSLECMQVLPIAVVGLVLSFG